MSTEEKIEKSNRKGFKFAIDRGGTFTDIWCEYPNGHIEVFKLLSEDPANYDDAPFEAIRRIISKNTGKFNNRHDKLDGSLIEWIRMGTTVATNALLERKGEKFALLITANFPDLLHIGNQSRPDLFDLKINMPSLLYENVVEIKERIILDRGISFPNYGKIVEGITGEKLRVLVPLDEEEIRKQLENLLENGIENIAVVLAHSYAYPQHEIAIGKLAKSLGFKQISLSHEIVPMIKIVPRGHTACIDAYLTPSIQRYIHGFMANFDPPPKSVLFMQSDGGLTDVASFYGSRAILSGPAAGVIGYALTTYHRLTDQAVIGFDMGGTSTDVSRYAGSLEHLFESHMGPGGVACVQSPQLDINTVAAGGGSQLSFHSGCLHVGPQSSGAHPGPACYRKGGEIATVTDANLILNRILPHYFPNIFGPNENESLDKLAALNTIEKLQKQINDYREQTTKSQPYSLEEVAMGFIDVANETMCRPIRALTQAKGYDTSQHALACFGGAGAQHACGIARKLGMKTVFVHRYAGILSAYGLALADVVAEVQEPCFLTYNCENVKKIDDSISQLIQQCRQRLLQQDFPETVIETEVFLHLRYDGTDNAIMCSVRDLPKNDANVSDGDEQVVVSSFGDFHRVFINRYKLEFGFTLSQRTIIVDDIRVRGTAKSGIQLPTPPANAIDNKNLINSQPLVPMEIVKVYFDNDYQQTNVFKIEELPQHVEVPGPAIIIDKNSTIVIEPNCTAIRISDEDLKITIHSIEKRSIGVELDPIQLSIFSHRFMSTAEQMGRVLQRTAISTNIKERLDFSCAIFGPDGGLVANAPHIPVHLGAMQHTVQYQMNSLKPTNSRKQFHAGEGEGFKDGDVILSNHPCSGGSHLPDLTVITPVFYRDIPEPVFFVANRGHHADIGGTTPGSMPPHSHSIFEEGAVFKTFFLVKNGEFQLEDLTKALFAPAQYPNCSGTRNLSDNLSDLKAQVAANQKGIHLIRELIDSYGLDVVQAYMSHIQNSAEDAVRKMLIKMSKKLKSTQLYAEDGMDDGSIIRLKITINSTDGSATFDFSNTSPQVLGNTNCPPAVTRSCLLYCLRCLMDCNWDETESDNNDVSDASHGSAIPLNQGCLRPIDLILSPGSLLWPDSDAAVVGGNVLTSQRIVDVILKAFQSCAASQGCMNNTTFGRGGENAMGYYETVAGGAGAGPGWHGRSGIHTHMTNTRITDLEILERRYPLILNRFSLRQNSGGKGKYEGGDGVVRQLWFREPLTLSVLSERRVLLPYGMHGGECGAAGYNYLLRNYGDVDSLCINLGGKVTVDVKAGDLFHLETPGGGGYGEVKEESQKDKLLNKSTNVISGGGGGFGGRPFVPKGSVFNYTQLQHST